jgi:transposase
MAIPGGSRRIDSGSVFAGIDVSKAHLDVAVRPFEAEWRRPNTDSGAREVTDQLKRLGRAIIVLEATGGIEIPVVSALAIAGLPEVVVNPRQVRDFAKLCVVSESGTVLRPEVRETLEAAPGG